MFRQREQKILFITAVIIFIAGVLISNILDINEVIVPVLGLAIFLIWFVSALIINRINKRVYNIRIATENIISEEKEKYRDDEIGKLASEISKLINLYQENLESKYKEKEFLRDVISDMSHQIKTPLAALSLFNEIMLEELDNEDFRAMLTSSDTQLERIKWLVFSMLKLSKLEAKSVCFDMSDTSCINILSSCVNMLQTLADAKNIHINIPDSDCYIYTDGEWLQEALVNIIKNAIEYSYPETSIDINVTKTPIASTICIKDYGDGIPEKDRLNVFKRFYRTDNSKSSNVGIGLALSKSIIEELGGKIWIESRHISQCIESESSYTAVYIMF